MKKYGLRNVVPLVLALTLLTQIVWMNSYLNKGLTPLSEIETQLQILKRAGLLNSEFESGLRKGEIKLVIKNSPRFSCAKFTTLPLTKERIFLNRGCPFEDNFLLRIAHEQTHWIQSKRSSGVRFAISVILNRQSLEAEAEWEEATAYAALKDQLGWNNSYSNEAVDLQRKIIDSGGNWEDPRWYQFLKDQGVPGF